jgi:DNA-binding transcriptional MerR regulator
MDVMRAVGGGRTYSSAEICAIFDITKSTLFRWEERGEMPEIDDQRFPLTPPLRTPNDERLYTQEQVGQIARYQLERLSRQIDRLAESQPEQAEQVYRRLSWLKYYQGDVMGLREIMGRREIEWPEFLRLVADLAVVQPPDLPVSVEAEAWRLAEELVSLLFNG